MMTKSKPDRRQDTWMAVGLFLLTAGLDEIANPRLRQIKKE